MNNNIFLIITTRDYIKTIKMRKRKICMHEEIGVRKTIKNNGSILIIKRSDNYLLSNYKYPRSDQRSREVKNLTLQSDLYLTNTKHMG